MMAHTDTSFSVKMVCSQKRWKPTMCTCVSTVIEERLHCTCEMEKIHCKSLSSLFASNYNHSSFNSLSFGHVLKKLDWMDGFNISMSSILLSQTEPRKLSEKGWIEQSANLQIC